LAVPVVVLVIICHPVLFPFSEATAVSFSMLCYLPAVRCMDCLVYHSAQGLPAVRVGVQGNSSMVLCNRLPVVPGAGADMQAFDHN